MRSLKPRAAAFSPLPDGVEMVELLPDAQLAVLPGTTHVGVTRRPGEVLALITPFLDADNFLFGQYFTGEPRNRSHVKDPALDDLLVRQRRTMDVKARREIINDIQRHLAKQQYYVHVPTGTYIAVWDGALKNYGPNLGYDYGGRLLTAWLDR